MKSFCSNFCFNCPKCKEAWEEVQREDNALGEAVEMDRRRGAKSGYPIGYRTTLEKAALDSKGNP